MDKTIYLTIEGAKNLHNELNHLISSERKKIIDAISEARAHGDLKENAEYHAAKEKQSFLEGRIQELQHKLSVAEIIDPSKVKNKDKVSFGAKVIIVDENNTQRTFMIVGEEESDTKKLKIAYTSPLARALLGKQIGDEVVLNTGGKDIFYELINISY